MNWLKIGAATLVGLLLLVGVLSVGGRISDPFGWKKHELASAKQGEATATGQAVVSGAQVLTAADVAAIVDAARKRDTQAIVIREENRNAIMQAPGADVRLDPALIERTNRGLCRYTVNDGQPGCAALRGSDTP